MKTTIAVLITCHNRKKKSLQCLQKLFESKLPTDYLLDVFLVDDGSTDGTGSAVKTLFPDVNIIQGSGDLFWNQGMRLAWKTAAKIKAYDFYFWLNDDTFLDSDALVKIFQTYAEAKIVERNEVLITAACREDVNNEIFSYGGRNDIGPVIPNNELQKCKYINGNAVMIPKVIYDKIGNLSNDYTHGMGDNDYGLRAIESGFSCYTTKNYVATCPPNVGIPGWCDPKIPLKKRWRLFHSVQGFNIKDYIKFRKRFWGSKWMLYSLKAYFRVIFPEIYYSFKK